jgi:hypothetical protein
MLASYSGTSQMTFEFVNIKRPSHRRGNHVPLAAVPRHVFGDRPAILRPFGHFSRVWRRKATENWRIRQPI